MLETASAEEIVDLVSSTIASRLKQVGEGLGEDLKRQEGLWDDAVDKVDAELRANEEAASGEGGEDNGEDNASNIGRQTNRASFYARDPLADSATGG